MHQRPRLHAFLTTLLVLVFAAFVAACGGDSKDEAARASSASGRVSQDAHGFGAGGSEQVDYTEYCGDGTGDELATHASIAVPSDAQPVPADTASGLVRQRRVPGMGYDVLTGGYFNPGGIRPAPILDMAKLQRDRLLQEDDDAKLSSHVIAGSSLAEYQRSASRSLSVSGGAGLFSGSVSTNFSTSTAFKANTAFITYRANVNKMQYLLAASPRALRTRYLHPDFQEDINDSKVRPRTLFNSYGTHMLAQMGIGGRLDMSFHLESSSYETKQSLERKVRAAYAAASAGVRTTTSTERKQLEDSHSLSVSSVGGATAITPTNDMAAVHNAYVAWSQSVDSDKPGSLSFIGPPSESMSLDSWTIPIWEFASSPARQHDICVEFHKRLDASAASIMNRQMGHYVTSLHRGRHANIELARTALEAQYPVTATQRSSAILQPLDLTAYVATEHNFFGWAFGANPAEAITDIHVGTEPTYTKAGVRYSVFAGSDANPLRFCGKTIFFTKDPRAAQADGHKLVALNVTNGRGLTEGEPRVATDAGWKLLTPEGMNAGTGCRNLSHADKVFLYARFMRPA